MNYNEVTQLVQQELQKRQAQPINPGDLQRAELAVQALGHPAWEAFAAHFQEQIVAAQSDLDRLKDRWAVSYADPLQDSTMHQAGAILLARIRALKEVLDYLPSLVKKVSHANQ